MNSDQNSPIEGDEAAQLTPNDQQSEAIHATSDRLRIVAGPGTGKTETLTRRIAHLIEHRDVPPESIIAFTFTEKAADELLTRVESHIGSLENRPWVGTIHSFCLELLEEYRDAVFDGDHTILGEEGLLVFLYTHYNDLELGDVRFPLNVIAAHFSKLMDLGIGPEEYVNFVERSAHRIHSLPDHRPDKQRKLEHAEDRRAIATAYQRYQEKLDELDAVDYPTMIQRALNLVRENDTVQADLAKQYSHLLVDEYQDTNRTQEALVDAIVSLGCQLCVVGDDDQSIYRFRGATVDNLLEFDDRFEATRTIPIETNYRSDSSIVTASQAVIQNNDRRLDKKIHADSETAGTIGLIHKRNQEAEIASVCDYIQTELAQGRISSPGDIALLFRSVSRDAGPYIEALQDRGIPVEVTGVSDVFMGDVVTAVLSVIDYILNEISLKKVCDRSALGLCEAARQDCQLPGSVDCGHPNCKQTIESIHQLEGEYNSDTFVSPQVFFYEILSQFPAIEELLTKHRNIDTAEQLRYLAGLSDVIGQVEDITEYTTVEYLRQILALVQDQGVEPDMPEKDGGINIMTVHQAKGLEFDTVIIPGLVEGKFPTHERSDPLQIPSQLRTEPEYKEGDDHISDERRLFYVAMTRAQTQLLFSSNTQGDRSRFLQELPDDLVSQLDPQPSLAETDERFAVQRRTELDATSFTQISYFTQCPLRYGLLFDYGFERTAQPQFYYGISVHRALERFFTAVTEGTEPMVDRLLSALDTAWISRGYAGDEQEHRFRTKAQDILTKYIAEHNGDLDMIQYVEHPFSILENGVRIEGKMDRVDRLPSGDLRVIDFKVGEAEEPGPWESFQLHLYALACERTLNETVAQCQFHFLTSDEIVSIRYDDAIRKKTVERLQSVLTDMQENIYSPNPGSYCENCDFNGFCPATEQ